MMSSFTGDNYTSLNFSYFTSWESSSSSSSSSVPTLHNSNFAINILSFVSGTLVGLVWRRMATCFLPHNCAAASLLFSSGPYPSGSWFAFLKRYWHSVDTEVDSQISGNASLHTEVDTLLSGQINGNASLHTEVDSQINGNASLHTIQKGLMNLKELSSQWELILKDYIEP